MKRFRQQTDRKKNQLRQSKKAGDMFHLNISLYKSALTEEVCFRELKGAVSGMHLTWIIHTNTHSCFNEKMTEESHRPSV